MSKSNTPILSDNDESRAPWNDALPKYVHKDYTLSFELQKTFDCLREEDDDDYDGVIDDVSKSHYSPIELIDYLHELLNMLVKKHPNMDTYQKVLKECEGWYAKNTEIV